MMSLRTVANMPAEQISNRCRRPCCSRIDEGAVLEAVVNAGNVRAEEASATVNLTIDASVDGAFVAADPSMMVMMVMMMLRSMTKSRPARWDEGEEEAEEGEKEEEDDRGVDVVDNVGGQVLW
ncbi:hypothetical protein CBR_g4431 [Chara braunii]|uniref:Uncharacterized protein n=1 Tax=Chara braunii TaxID=69332 RepID=A0A388KHS7_CHABU|nr:hypothetical protein CBR_g4431 [Chara braunii]|eukprot:GBG69601.1 hypothetical protein CBR_g4431 [Chara braunii]